MILGIIIGFVGGFVFGVLFGRRNRKKVEIVVGAIEKKI
jgi:hypothetical protein